MASERFAYIWQYQIEPSRRSEFLAAYGPGGDWVELFSRDPAYLETKLLRDVANENRYLTIDFWKSKADRDSFGARYSDEFDELDGRCEVFTQQEEFLGDYIEFDDTAV